MFDCLLMFMIVVVLMNLDDNANVDEDCEDDEPECYNCWKCGNRQKPY